VETIGRPRQLDRAALPGRLGAPVSLVGLVILVAAAAWWWGRGWDPLVGLVLFAGGALLATPFGIARRRAQRLRIERVLAAWGRERGLLLVDRHGNPGGTPLLSSRGLLGPVLLGPVGGDPHGLLGHYAFTVRSGTTTYQAPYTVAIARFEGREGLCVRIHESILQSGPAAVLDDWAPFPTASAEIHERFAIEVRDGHDPVLVAELLDPVALRDLLEEEVAVAVEIDNGVLVLSVGGHVGVTEGVEDLAWLDVLRERADRWGERIARV
jgi:hypothetical protein